MNEQDYRFLLDLYKTKNITKMAQRQFLTQPAMTKRIKKIEEELGCELMLRNKKGVIFTPVGETVVRYCSEMMQMNQQLKESINRSQGIVGGTLSIGSSLNYCRYRLPGALQLYHQKYPMVDISISTG
ncbi:MAG: LysR family transcriptional regulator, partial [Pygmaiobacter sp.]